MFARPIADVTSRKIQDKLGASSASRLRTLIYKRTHEGDPDSTGQFGIYDCMGRVRGWKFEAVIGVGGVGAESISHGLTGKVNWIGVGPHKRSVAARRGPIVTFDRFLLLGSDGPDLEALAPQLAERIYSNNIRAIMNGLSDSEQKEVETILALAKDAPPSSARRLSRKPIQRCSR
jgi:hypothetical protein